MSFLKFSIAICIFLSTNLTHAMDQEPITLAIQGAKSLQEELNDDQSRTIPAFPRHLFFDLGLNLDENVVKEAFQEQKKVFKSLNVQIKTEVGAALNRQLTQIRAAGQEGGLSIAPGATVVVITMQVCGQPVTISMPIDARNSLIRNGLKAQLRRRIADISQQVGSFQQTHIPAIRKNVKEFRKSEAGVAILKTFPQTYLSLCHIIAKDLTDDLSDSAQRVINAADIQKHDSKIATTKAEFEKDIQVLRKLEPVATKAKLLNMLKTEIDQTQFAQTIKSKIEHDFCSSFEQYVQSQVER